MLRGKLLRSYPKLEDGHPKKDGQGNPIIVFVYRVTGTPDELKEYERIQRLKLTKDETVRDDEGYLFFTTRPTGRTCTLKISPNEKVFVDTTDIDLANAMIKQYGVLGQVLAKEILNSPNTEDIPVNDTGKLD